MASANDPFKRSSQTNRSPPQRQNDSTVVDPNATSCQLCQNKDTVEMVECERCKNWFHFQCVGVDSSVASITWYCRKCTQDNFRVSHCQLCPEEDSTTMLECVKCKGWFHSNCVGADSSVDASAWTCRRCVTPLAIAKNVSIRSSTSSKRKSILQLERLAKEKAIQDKLIEEKTNLATQQAAIDSEFLHKEYDIRDNMTDSEDDDTAGDDNIEKTSYVTDWLQTTNTVNPDEKFDKSQTITGRDSLLKLGATSSQTMQAALDEYVITPSIEGLQLIPPKHVQFAQPLSNEFTEDTTHVATNPMGNVLNQPPAGPTSLDPFSSASNFANHVVNNPMGIVLNRPPVGPTSLDPFSSASNYTNQRPLIPVPIVSISAQTSITTSMPSSVPSRLFTSVSVHQPTTGYMSVHQPPIANVPVYQQPQSGPTSVQQQSSTPIFSQQPPIVPNVSQQFGMSSNTQLQQPIIPSIVQQPTVSIPAQQFVSYQQPIPTFAYQQPIISSVANQQQVVMNPTQPPMPIPGVNASGYGQFPLTATNQWLTYDPQLNSQQLPPSRLQLAARQTMPRDYPKFNGDPEKWSIFLNAYVNCTTECGLSNGENLSRLERCLVDPARKAVHNLLTRPEAVPDIIETLKMLYGRPEASIDSQLRIIRNEAAPKMNKMETFIDFAMSVRNVTSEIQKTGLWQYLWNPQLMQELVEKLPYQMRMEWGQIKMTSPNVNLSSFSEWLFLRARTACAVTLPSSANNKPNSGSHVNSHVKGNDSEKKNSRDTPKRYTNSNPKTCNACTAKSHDIYECRKFLGMELQDRWETVKSNKLCRICLGNHHVLRCDSKSLCGESGCTVKHHRLLHNHSKIAVPTTTTTTSNETHHSAHQQSKMVNLRRYIPVTLYGPKTSMNVLAFLDDGSDMTLVENWVAQKLGLNGPPKDLFLEWTAKIVRKEPNSKTIALKISGTRTNNKKYELTDVRTVKALNLPYQTINADQLRDTYPFLRRIPIESYSNETPKILIGLRDCKVSTPRKIRSGAWDDPIATKTLLGWEIHGAQATSSQVTKVNLHFDNEMSEDDKLHQMIAQFFSLENFGVKTPELTVEALADKRAKQLLESTSKRIGTKFETGLLWKYDDISLPDSLPMAKRRLESLEKRLQKDPDLAMKFRAKFHEYVEQGYVRKLTKTEETERTAKTWYLPLFPVTYPKKPGKIRLVWDAAAKVSNVSLNSMLLSGPDLLVSLPGVLYRFREGAYVVTGDIREMFHQVAIRKEDQMSQRFLWREEGSQKIEVYVLQVMSFGATCSPSSAQHIKNHNALQFIEQYPRAETAIRKNTYVDDWLQSFDTEAEAENVANEVKYVHSQGGFEIRNWLSNSPQVSRNLGTNTEDEQKLSFDLDESQTERILGMWWNVKQDSFTYSLRYNPFNKDILIDTRRPTKREALRTLMSIYDPLGLLASYLIHLKMILQDIWRTGIGWDQQISENDDDHLYDRWLNWIKQLPAIEHIRINRQYSDKINFKNPPGIELHIFVDAGELAYATVAYFRVENEDGVDCCLIGGKTKVAPLRPLSVPRMELQAAILGSRFKNSILENHTLYIARTVIWSDSSTVIKWLRSDLRKYTQYVGVRVSEILETTTLSEWRWIPSEMNPADDATKWKNSFNLDMNCRWFKGPDFLTRTEEFWPNEKVDDNETEKELRPKYVHAHMKVEVENLPIKFERFTQWIRSTGYVYRFINNVKAKLGKLGFATRNGPLMREELQVGESALYRKAQRDEFILDIAKLQEEQDPSIKTRLSVEKTSSIYRYSPYLDQANVLRMRGRIDAASNVSMDQKRPIILPTKHQITDLVVLEYHHRYKHQNTETVINEIKQKFIIPRLRALLKRIRRECQHCKNTSAQPMPPEMAELPVGRLSSFTRAFTFVGVDYAGPYTIIANRKALKRWIVIFTCLTTRAVYIDLVESLTTDSCIMAIRRFIARNGTPREFYSDQGTNFKGADNELTREIAKIDHELVDVTFSSCYTQWNFNPPYAQHMGGAWERLIQSMKTTLDKILPKSHYPNQETLATALAEVENIINSRPLTFVSIEPDDTEALTPNHFLKGSSNGNKPPGVFPSPPTTLRSNWRYSQQIADEFWRKWVKEYLPVITRRTKWFDDVKPIEVDDQVIIVDENAPRNTWTRGVVVEATKTGRDQRISRVKVRTANGIYTRPVTKLAVLDVKRTEAKTPTSESLAEGSVTASNDK